MYSNDTQPSCACASDDINQYDDGNTKLKVRLVRKYARAINGVDLSPYAVGDVLDLTISQANLLMAEGWAVAADGPRARRSVKEHLNRAADVLRRSKK